MSEDSGREHDERKRSQRATPDGAQPIGSLEGLLGFASETARASALMGDPRLNGRGNGPVKATVMQRMQQTWGNRGVRASLQRTASRQVVSARTQGDVAGALDAVMPVQREDAPAGATDSAATTNFNPVSTTYDVTGTTLKEAFDQISQRKEAGDTSWNPKYSFNQSGGKVTSVTIDVEITVLMPKWDDASKLGKDAKAEWDRFYKALQAHEDAHVELVKKKFQEVAKNMVGKSVAAAKKEFSKALSGLKKDSDDFDKRTDHGRKEGTILDTSKDAPPKPGGGGTAPPTPGTTTP